MYRVLLVEDDAALRFIYKRMKTWSECGYTIAAEVGDGAQAVRLLEKESFDLIFSDIRMPLMDGIELLRWLNEKGDNTLFIFASSYNEFEYARQGLVLGAFDYLLKPVEEKKLADVLNRAKKRISEKENAKIDRVVTGLLQQLGLSAAEDDFVRKIAEYCTLHYKEGLTTDELADIHGFRSDYFGKVFKQHFKIPYSEFRLRIKVAYAIELLRTGNYKAYEVSDILGFSSYKYFNERFKAVTGVTPAEYKFGTGEKK